MADMPLDDGKLDAAVFYNRKFFAYHLGGPPVPVREKLVLEPQMSRDEQILALGPIKGVSHPAGAGGPWTGVRRYMRWLRCAGKEIMRS